MMKQKYLFYVRTLLLIMVVFLCALPFMGATPQPVTVQNLKTSQDELAEKIDQCIAQHALLLENQQEILRQLNIIRIRVSR